MRRGRRGSDRKHSLFAPLAFTLLRGSVKKILQVAYESSCVNFPPWYNDVHDLLVGRRNRPDARGRRIAATPGFAAC